MATPAPNTATEASHQHSVRQRQPRGPQPPRDDHGHDGAAEDHDVGVADEGRDLERREPGEAGPGAPPGAASVASIAHSRIPEPAATSEASVNVGM